MKYVVTYNNGQSVVLNEKRYNKLNMSHVKEVTKIEDKPKNTNIPTSHTLTYNDIKCKISKGEMNKGKAEMLIKAYKKQYEALQQQIVKRYAVDGLERYKACEIEDIDNFKLENTDYYRLLGKMKSIESIIKLLTGYNKLPKTSKKTTIKTLTEIHSSNKEIVQLADNFTL